MTMLPNAERIAKALGAKRSGDGWSAKCPAHDDSNPSLSISDSEKGPLVHCHAGCEQSDVIHALRERDLWPKDGEIPTAHGQLGPYSAHWDYHDASGQHVMRVCRWDRANGKEIRPLTFQDGRWTWKSFEKNRPLYRLPALKDTNKRVIVCEGEKATEAAQKFFPDMIATTWSGGAKAINKTDWKPLSGRDVTLVADNDEPGKKAMESLAAILSAQGCTVRHADLSRLGDLPEGWDVADALGDKSFDLDALWNAIENAQHAAVETPAGAITARHIGEIIAKPSRVRWLIRNEIERGVIAVLAGKRGTFKSFIALHWAMRIATAGEPVLMVSAEGSGMDRRAMAWIKTHSPKTDPRSLPIYVIERRVDFSSAEAIQAVKDEIARLQIKPALIVIDTLSKNSGGLDENDNSEVKAFIGGLDLGLRTPLDATVLIVAHTGHGDQTRARGASALEADTDAAYIVQKHSEGMVSVSRERFKDAPELPPLNYQVQVVDLGYCDDYGEPVTSCALVETDAPPPAKPELKGKRQRQLLDALRERNSENKVWGLAEMRQVARSVGMNKHSARSAVDALACSPYMTPTVGGYQLTDGDGVEGLKRVETHQFNPA